ncbi:MAG: hypothetical protein II868_07965 [Butyrivibrio sp.]|nr:hypothetical protein [Butyrivibrio sp.]
MSGTIKTMEYVNEPEERVFEPSFGYGYIPEEDRPALPKKKRKNAAQAAKDTSAQQEDTGAESRLLNRKPGMPVAAFAVAILLAALLLLGALVASTGTTGHVSACETYTVRLPL